VNPAPSVLALIAECTAVSGNVIQDMVQDVTGNDVAGGAGIEIGGYVKLGTATNVVLTVRDAKLKNFYTETLTADTVIFPGANGVTLPLQAISFSVTPSTGTFTVYWHVQK